MGLFVLRPVPGDGIDERLVVCLAFTCSHGRGLAMGLGDELGRPNVRHPNLDRAKSLTTQPFSMLSDTVTGGSHTTMLHVTCGIVDQSQPHGHLGLRGAPEDMPHINGRMVPRTAGSWATRPVLLLMARLASQ